MCSIGVDVAQGGADQTILSQRFDSWFAPLLSIPGEQTPGGSDVAGAVLAKRRDGAKVIVDLGGGWGGDALKHLVENHVDADGYMGVKTSTRRTEDNQLTFFNVRTEAYWRLREALKPDQPGGSAIQLPNDRELLADLTAPKYKIEKGGIKLEPKDDLVKRLGRSPDKGDAVVMAWYSGAHRYLPRRRQTRINPGTTTSNSWFPVASICSGRRAKSTRSGRPSPITSMWNAPPSR
jgi:hypothetical protein